MKYCPKCGTEMPDDSSYCPKCGAWQNAEPQQQKCKYKTGFVTANKVLLIVCCAILCLVLLFGIVFGILFAVAYRDMPQTPVDPETEGSNPIGLIVMSVYMIMLALPLAWVLPMTVHYFKKVKAGQAVTVAFKICTLLFVNVLVGVFMLCFEPHADDVQC